MRQDDPTVRNADAMARICPDLGAGTPEPSLREIVLGYYDAHFPIQRARELTDAYFAALSPADGDAGAIPEGMVPWAGGDAAPEDWDGGPVLRRKSNVRAGYSICEIGHPDWWKRHEVRGKRHLTDVIAYTPRNALTPTETGEQGK